jgi:hypothetical protein
MIVDLLVWAFIAYLLIHLGAFIQRIKYNMEEDEEDDEDDETPQEVIAMIQCHGGVMYAYDDSVFLGQGVTMEDLEEHMKLRIKEVYTTSVRVQMMTEDKDLIAKYNLTPN